MTQSKLNAKTPADVMPHSRVKWGVELVGTIGLQVSAMGALAIAGNLSIQQIASAQSAITNVTATYADAIEQSFTTAKTASPCDLINIVICGATSTTTFGKGTNNDLQVSSVATASGTYLFRKLSDSVRINRINNTIASGERQIIFFEAELPITKPTNTTPGIFNIFSGAVSTMEAALLNQSINRGSDNIFGNAGSGNSQNFNNIERLDYIINSGVTPTTNAELDDIGFVVMDRGASDSYKIAPILTLSAGLPDTFGLPKVFAISGQTTINNRSSSLFYAVMRLEAGATVSPDNLRPSDTTTQSIGGHFVSLRDLGITVGQTIYGYSLLSPIDGPTTAANMKLVNSTNYPTGTNLNNGGIDLIAGGGIFSKNLLPIVTSTYTLSGNVFNDVSGNKLRDGTEPIVNGTTLGLNAVLFDVTGNKVYAVSSVSATGSYSFGNVQPGNYTVILTTATASVSGPMPTIVLPTNWTTTGENLSGTVETTPATPDSKIAITVAAANITNLNFGIEQLPTAVTTTAPSQANPGGTTSVAVPVNLFNTSTDPDTGTVDKYRITVFPTNATSITIDGIVYTATAQPGTTVFTAGGVIVDKTKLNTITVDPIDGAVTVDISFKAIDNAGKESANTANAIVPFTAGSTPELILLKRITKINGTTTGKTLTGAPIDFTTVVPQPDNASTPRDESGDASNPNWVMNYPKGSIDGGVIKSGDTVEYTIYFLSTGNTAVKNANICDWVPSNTTFVPNSYGAGKGIELAIGSTVSQLSNVPDNDRGDFFNVGAIVPGAYPSGTATKLNCATPTGNDGAVVVNLVNTALLAPNDQLPNATAAGTPGNSYGFVRFVSKVK